MSISVRLKPEAEARLSNAVIQTGKPRNALINDAILTYFKSYDDEARQRDIARQCQLANEADKRDNLDDFGDF